MLMNSASFPSIYTTHLSPTSPKTHIKNPITCLKTISVDDLAQLTHNKVLVGAAVSAAIGQLSKPFTSCVLYRKEFDLRSALQAGGFPSTHSSAVVATATSLGLERGFADSIFGMAVVYAGLVMYDAQGVRREVGNHAKTLNKILPSTQVNSISSKEIDLINSRMGVSSPANLESLGNILSEEKVTTLIISDEKRMMPTPTSLCFDFEEGTETADTSSNLLKESIGHTEIEVIAGAFLGFVVSVAVYNIL